MTGRLLVTGGRVIDPANGVDEALDVLIDDGVVAAVGSGLAADDAEHVDASGCVVAPGLVDLHTHLREPGFEHKGTIATETLAALRGGFTSICAMPNTLPAPDSGPVVESLQDRIARDARVRVYPVGCITRERAGKQLAELSELAEAGCVAFSDDGDPVANASLMRHALELAGSLGLPVSEHSDDPVLNAGGCMNEGRISERLGLPGQAAAAEITAIGRNIALAETSGAHVHIAHISTAQGVRLVADAKSRGLRVTCEVTPSHLFLTEDAVYGRGPEPAYETAARVNPPLRTEDDRQALLAGVRDGVIDAIATDHAPHAVEDKLCEFEDAAPGISCLETAVPTIMELVRRGELPLAQAIRALTTAPATVFGLDGRLPGTGALTPGVSRDLVVIDAEQASVVDPSRFASKGQNSPLAGMTLHGAVRAVVLNGALALKAAPHG